ncbi:MAG TPA: FrgA protein, partial [Archangium sp.]
MRHQTAQGGSIDTALMERRLLPEPQVLHALGEASGLRPVNLADFEPNADVASFIPPKIADRLCVVPLSLDGSTLHVACGYPVPKKELEEVGFLLGKPLELWVATEVRVREWISVIYRQPLPPRYGALLAALDPERMGAAAPAAPQPVQPVQPAQPAAAPVQPAPAPVAKPAPAPAPPPKPADDAALTLEMVERLARSVAAEPFPLTPEPPPQPAPKPPPQPQPPQQPQRATGAPPAPAAGPAPTQPPRPAAPAAPPASAAPATPAATPPAAIREPLRLNMPEPGRPAAPPPQAQPAPAARPAAAPPQAQPA